MGIPRLGRRRWAALPLTVVTAAAVTVAIGAPAADAGTIYTTNKATFIALMRGNGHAHGMSQYGARGAAIAGRSYPQILSFYYPGSALTKVPSAAIKVKIGLAGSTTTIGVLPGLTVTGVAGILPTAGVSRYRLAVGTGATLTLKKLGTARGAVWTTVRAGLPNNAQFHSADGLPLRLYLPDGSSTSYSGYLRAVRGAGTSGITTVNVVSLDAYTAGVVPREIPASWQRAAVDAQAVAARTYAWYEHLHASSSAYDICDTTACQVYGGHEHYSASGKALLADFPSAATDTAGQILTYKGAAIFSQFAASDGGWSTSGGQPYLIARADPYDSTASGDPYLSYRTTVSVASVARYFGLSKLSRIVVTARDGHGTWGGRATEGYVVGTDSKGKAHTVRTDGLDLQYAMGLGTTWFHLIPR